MKKPRIIFMGTPEFAIPSMKALHNAYNLQAVVTVPDKPQGRGMQIVPSPIKEVATNLNIKILQPQSLKDENFINEIKFLNPDIIAVVAFRILPKEVYEIANLAAFNIHASLLPKYRGAAPINHAIINGESKTGLTSFILNDSVDTGNIILQEAIELPQNIIATELYYMLSDFSAEFSIKTVECILSKNYKLKVQDETLSTNAPKLFKQNTKINWEQSAKDVVNFIHGSAYVPGAWTLWEGNLFKIYRAGLSLRNVSHSTAGDFEIMSDRFLIKCADKSIEIFEFQPTNKKKLSFNNFINGYRGPKKGKFE